MSASTLLYNSPERGNGLLQKLLLPNPTFQLNTPRANERLAVEDYIATHFNRTYAAEVSSFLPLLFTMKCQQNYSATLGLRSAQHAPLFLEQYLDAPIEDKLVEHFAEPIHRHHIVEIGNLVATQRGASYLLFVLVAAILSKVGVRWLTFTATEQVQHILKRLKFKTYALTTATESQLQSSENWGSYYQQNPCVMVGDLRQTHDLIMKNKMLRMITEHYEDIIDTLAQTWRRH